MAIRKYSKKMNGGSVADKFWEGKDDTANAAQNAANATQDFAKTQMNNLKEANRIRKEKIAQGNNPIMPSGITGGVPQQPVMNQLAIPPSPPALPPKFGGRRRRRRRRTRKKRGRGKVFDPNSFDYDSWADQELGNEFGGVYNTGHGGLEVHSPKHIPKPKPKHIPKPKPKRKPTLKHQKNSRKLVGVGGKRRRRKRKTRRRRRKRKTRRRRR